MTVKDQETQLMACFFVELVDMFLPAIGISLDKDRVVMKEHPHYQLLIHFYAHWCLYRLAHWDSWLIPAIEALSFFKLLLDGDLNFIVTLEKSQEPKKALLVLELEPVLMLKFRFIDGEKFNWRPASRDGFHVDCVHFGEPAIDSVNEKGLDGVERDFQGEALDFLKDSLSVGGEVSREGTNGFDKPDVELVSSAVLD